MLIALASLKGSPGVTSLGVALTAAWPGDLQRAFVECDPAGGDIAARYSLPLSPGLIGLAAATRRDSNLHAVWAHTQTLPDGTPVVVGPLRGDQARTALKNLVPAHPEKEGAQAQSSPFDASAGSRDNVVVTDCGRLDPESPVLPIVEMADALLLLLRPRADELSRLAALLDDIATLTDRVGLVLVGPGYSPSDVATELQVPIFASVPDLQHGTRANRFGQARARNRLHRAAVTIAEQLTVPADATEPERAGSGPATTDTDAPESDEHIEDETSRLPELTTHGPRP
jgi:hypothetical protein